MLGRFLEISVACDEPLDAMRFYEALGFREVAVGDVWSHDYAVVSDGALNIGLHGYQFDSPALTFVQRGLDHWAEAYKVQNIELAFAKLSPDEFNELGFVDPGGQMVTVLESRTFSPPPFEHAGFSHFGAFDGIATPCEDAAASKTFWTKFGCQGDDKQLECAGIRMRFEPSSRLTCHYRGDPLALAEFAAREGLQNVVVSADESAATVKTGHGILLRVARAG